MEKSLFFIIKRCKEKIINKIAKYFFVFPKKKFCNICKWSGFTFLDDQWHKNVICPNCGSTVRHRLFKAAIDQNQIKEISLSFDNKKVLHCAPDRCLKKFIKNSSASYLTGDLFKKNCDLRIDLCSMDNIEGCSFDVIIAFDILEHVASVKNALSEIHRVLTDNGYAIFTIPQQDGLKITIEEKTILSPTERTIRFGQWDHRRIFGEDFKKILVDNRFKVSEISSKNFTIKKVSRNGLKPEKNSLHPLASNDRKIYFCKKVN